MDREEMEEWRTIFNLFDVDGDESITSQVETVVHFCGERVQGFGIMVQ